MGTSQPAQRSCSRASEISNLDSSTQTTSVEETQCHSEVLSSTPVGQRALQSHGNIQQQYAKAHTSNLSEPDAETSLLHEQEPTKEAPNNVVSPVRWNALGLFAICILTLGTIGISVSMALLAYIWRSSMRSQAGHIDNGHLWDFIIRGNWTSVTVTITAAVIRVCLGFQMGILTGMIASLLIERTGVPMSSAPLISMLRALSASPYNLVSRKTLMTPLAVAIILAVLLTGASNFTSTALLVDFENTNITTSKQTIEVRYGSSQSEDAAGPGSSSDIPLTSEAGGALRGFKIWNSQPNTYFRLAETSNNSDSIEAADEVGDSGSALRAILPFPDIADRINLREYEGPSIVFDSRVVCTRPKLDDIKFSAVVAEISDLKTSRFDKLFVEGNFLLPIPDKVSPLNSEVPQPPHGWRMKCVIPAPSAASKASYRSTSICSVKLGILTQDSDITKYPVLRSAELPIPRSWTTTFLIFNTTGSIEEWREYLTQNGHKEDQAYLLWQSTNNESWEQTGNGIWAHWRPLIASSNTTISITACPTNLAGVYQDVNMLSGYNGLEPSLSWDSVSERYNTSLIRERYTSLHDANNAKSRDFRGVLDLRPKVDWRIKNFTDADQMIKTTRANDLDYWMRFDSIIRGLPYMNLNGNDAEAEILPSGILFPGAFSPHSVHYAHAALFQDIFETIGSLATALQALFTVLRQMTYYEHSPYFDKKSTAVVALSSEKLIPTRWTGFILVAIAISVHFTLLTVDNCIIFRMDAS